MNLSQSQPDGYYQGHDDDRLQGGLLKKQII